jgi:hypothetical protein
MNIEQLNKIRQIKVQLSSAKVNDISSNDFADYPWDQCIADQIKAYGSKDIAEAVCGKIKAENQSKEKMDITPNPCEPGYEPIGLKEDGAPNCVPKEKHSKVKDGAEIEFVIPKPEKGEAEKDYIGRCMMAIGSEYDTQEQALAVCYSQLK